MEEVGKMKDYIKSNDKFNNETVSSTKKSVMESLDDLETLEYHRSIAEKQRSSYKTMKDNLAKDTLFIELDYKEKLKIGLSPVQISKEFYSQKQRSLLGFGVYFRNENNQIDYINFDIISDNLSQTAEAVIDSFRLIFFSIKLNCFLFKFYRFNSFLRTNENFKAIDKKKYIIWCDTGFNTIKKYILYFF